MDTPDARAPDRPWPTASAFLDPARFIESSDGRVRCAGVAICNDAGEPCLRFGQGEVAHVFCEFEVRDEIEVPSCGLVLRTAAGVLAHGKNTLQHRTEVPRSVQSGQRLRWHHDVRLDLGLGDYWVSVGFASTDAASYALYRDGRLSDPDFSGKIRPHSRLDTGAVLTVGLNRSGQLSHHGIANLPGAWRIAVAEVDRATRVAQPGAGSRSEPVWLIVSHPQGGGEWLSRVVAACAPDRLGARPPGNLPFSTWILQPGRVYTGVVAGGDAFDDALLPASCRRLIVLRDLRDTLVAGYFALKGGTVGGAATHVVRILQAMEIEDGLLYLMDEWLPSCAALQLSWVGSGNPVSRYEDLRRDQDALSQVLIEQLGLPCDREALRRAVVIANGPGPSTAPTADPDLHRPGLWRDLFTPRVAEAFKSRYAEVLRASGHEPGDSWTGPARLPRRRVTSPRPGLVYVASYPRSGNTWIRNLVRHYFHRRVASLYPEEASANLPPSATVSLEQAFYIYPVDSNATEFARSLRSDLGRIFSDEVRRRVSSSFQSVFLKTHELPYSSYFDREAVIYVVRHPAAVVWSYFNYLRDHGLAPGVSLEDVIRGRVPFGSWSEHVTAWLEASAKLGDRLILSRFEELAANHEPLLDRIAALTGLRIVEATGSFPAFSYWHENAPQFYRAGDDETWKAHLRARDLDLIRSLHGPAMARLGYGL